MTTPNIDVAAELGYLGPIASAPDDLYLRFKYADYLIGRNDPRGFSIMAMTASEQAQLIEPHVTPLHRLAVNRWCLAFAAAGFVGLVMAARRGADSWPVWQDYVDLGLGLLGGIPCALNLSDCDLDDWELADLAACPYLVTIRQLFLANNLICDEGAIALARSAHVPHLLELDLDNNQIGDDGARALLAMPPSCAIYIAGNRSSEPVLHALAGRGARTEALAAAD